ncbi:LysR family transcriptional regulator (chromosome initiation inhibitor) [Paraburkholderia sp. BL23I1N1]|uniref:HTH-type transcriptional regulator ArgP n=1 Tax=unclassified Paraburkholderia TaxID=2615204 RepID=UPI000A4A6057|nr:MULTISPECIES: HTH-type transcriptional regulator ArgP [unclassified Paraburkholderia]REE18585.1 LysR family transcriptional regulator (chromosome initiation inhibitor) [Paraburkholderia sp. BL27I4N3]RKE35599.1 LysR family transcriptional regulator (chromosome initiation inhibitor) [Paraburkholderia sp. BL23I1N1]
MLNMTELETFAAVVEYRSFSQAAAALNISSAAATRRVKRLERSTGALLLIREPTVMPTQAGEKVYRHFMSIRLREDDLLREIEPGRAATTALALAINADSLATWFEPVTRELVQYHVELEILVDDQDHTLDALARGDVKGFLSTQAEPVGERFAAEPVGQMRYQCVASPGFAREHFAGGLILPGALKAPAILFDRKDRLHDIFLRSYFGATVGRYIKHYLPSPSALFNAIVDGVGYGLVPAMQAEPRIIDGRLVALAPDHDVMIDLYWHHWEQEPESLAKISALVMEAARRSLVQPAPEGDGGS